MIDSLAIEMLAADAALWRREFQARLDEFNEEDHPRGPDGKFGEGTTATPKTEAHLAHAKAARDSAKQAVLHTKAIREAFKKEPLNTDLEEKLSAAENASKAARGAARKAEAATTEKEAAKHAAKAAEHAAKAKAHLESIKTAPSPASGHTIDKGAKKQLETTYAKLKDDSSLPPPSSWSPEKHEAAAAAKAALDKHSGAFNSPAPTPAMLKGAADAFDAVAAKASAAGSYWGSGYKAAANQLRDAATPKEKFELAPHAGVKTTVAEKSARPIDGIKGEVVQLKTFKDHREQYAGVLNSAEKAATLKYSGSSYKEINSNLRKDGAPDKTVHDLDAAIAKAPAPRDMIVHRGLRGTFSKELFSEMKPGDQFIEKAYSSTSAGGTSAFGGGHGDVELHITVPKGYPAAPIPSHHAHEHEYLLRRNTKFQVTKIEKVGSTVHAHVTVVHEDKESA